MSENFEMTFIRISGSGKAACFKDEDGDFVWLPLSQIEFDYRASAGEAVDVEMPEWLAREKGLA